MIVLDKPKLRFLLAGRTITVTVGHDRFRKGRSYSVSTAHNKPATCTATVIGIRVTSSGRELDIKQNRDSQDLFMARYSPHGYTSKLGQSLGCEDAPVVDAATQARFSKEGRERDQLRQQSSKRRETVRSLAIRMKDAERRGDAEAFAAIRREMMNVEDQLRRDAA